MTDAFFISLWMLPPMNSVDEPVISPRTDKHHDGHNCAETHKMATLFVPSVDDLPVWRAQTLLFPSDSIGASEGTHSVPLGRENVPPLMQLSVCGSHDAECRVCLPPGHVAQL